jgi:hypothetical protein
VAEMQRQITSSQAITLGQYMLEKQLTLLGTMRANKTELPKEIASKSKKKNI